MPSHPVIQRCQLINLSFLFLFLSLSQTRRYMSANCHHFVSPKINRQWCMQAVVMETCVDLLNSNGCEKDIPVVELSSFLTFYGWDVWLLRKWKKKEILLLTMQVKVSEGLYAWWLYKGTHWILQLFRGNEQLLALTKSLIWFDVDWSGYIVIVIVRELICNTWQNFTGRI